MRRMERLKEKNGVVGMVTVGLGNERGSGRQRSGRSRWGRRRVKVV
jgi:hypothetical protein